MTRTPLLTLSLVLAVSLARPATAQRPIGSDAIETLATVREQIEVKDRQISVATGDRQTRLLAERAALETKLESIATGLDVKRFERKESEDFNIQAEIESLLEPLVRQLKSATEEPRGIERLKTRLELLAQRQQLANTARQRIARLRDQPSGNADLKANLEALFKKWNRVHAAIVADQQVTQYELNRKLAGKKSLLESTRGFVQNFFKSRGFNLLVAIGAFFAMFLTMRFLQRRIQSIRRGRERSFYRRLAGVAFHVLVFVASFAAMIVALFAVNDWVLLVILLIFLIGVGWGSIRMLPQFFEQIRLMLNLGSVREGERVIFNGLPWHVESLRLYSTLVNPRLTGGLLRIPVRDLIGYHSRPIGANEQWFPCAEGDWVVLGDGTRGVVLTQTPDMVELELPGGGQKIYQTGAFLEQNPWNLSRNYRIEVVFGIDYQHQAAATTEIPKLLKQKIETGLLDILSPKEILKVEVEFMTAAASSLDYELQVDVDGSAAAKYERVQHGLSRLAVDACNENGWVIPFQQITLHQAS